MKMLRRIIAGAALAAAVSVPLLAPSPAEAWWHGGWGWHAGWGWGWGPRVVVGVPPVVVGAPVAPGYYYHWVPGYYAVNGVWVPPHWGYY
jgi:hypothetical protein